MTPMRLPVTFHNFPTNRNLGIPKKKKSVEETKVFTEWKAVSEIAFVMCYQLHHPPLRGLEYLVFDTDFSLWGLCIFVIFF